MKTSAKELLHKGFLVHDLVAAGYTEQELQESGISADELEPYFSSKMAPLTLVFIGVAGVMLLVLVAVILFIHRRNSAKTIGNLAHGAYSFENPQYVGPTSGGVDLDAGGSSFITNPSLNAPDVINTANAIVEENEIYDACDMAGTEEVYEDVADNTGGSTAAAAVAAVNNGDEMYLEVENGESNNLPASEHGSVAVAVAVGDKVKVVGYECSGTVRYVGPHLVDPTKGIRVLVELDEPVGKNNGTVKGMEYCAALPAKTGVLVVAGKVAAVPHEHGDSDDDDSDDEDDDFEC